MTTSTPKAPASVLPSSPTTKSLCPAGAGLIDQPAATKSAYTPPKACAPARHDRAIATHREEPHAQLSEGYKHPFLVRRPMPETEAGKRLQKKLNAIDTRLAKAEARPSSKAQRNDVKHLRAEFKATLTELKAETVLAATQGSEA